LLASIKPNLLHTHYASGYGTLSRLVGFFPTILSIWGSDVFEFPYESRLNRFLLRKNLEAADYLWATSNALQRQAMKFVAPRKPIAITPFGVDCEQFRPALPSASDDGFVVGTVKALEPVYGVDKLFRAFALFKDRVPRERRLKLIVAGGGSLRSELGRLAFQLGIADQTEFTGPVAHKRVPRLLDQFSVFVALSERESFGVGVLEASACELPVIVSDAGGLPEVVVHGETGFVVPGGDSTLAANALECLFRDGDLADRIGQDGRRFVLANYEWRDSVEHAESLYRTVLADGSYAGF
jgi:glycosyltransferase involved in cell wall biosynthesis